MLNRTSLLVASRGRAHSGLGLGRGKEGDQRRSRRSSEVFRHKRKGRGSTRKTFKISVSSIVDVFLEGCTVV